MGTTESLICITQVSCVEAYGSLLLVSRPPCLHSVFASRVSGGRPRSLRKAVQGGPQNVLLDCTGLSCHLYSCCNISIWMDSSFAY